MSAASPVRALAWKETHGAVKDLLLLLVAMLVVAAIGSAMFPERWGYFVLLFVMPFAAAGGGAGVFAPERSERTLPFLLARPVALGTTLACKVTVRAALTAVACAEIVAVVVIAGGAPPWSEFADAPRAQAFWLCAMVNATCFLAAAAVSLHLADEVTAAPAGMILAASGLALALAPALVLADKATALTTLPWVAPLVLAVGVLAVLVSARLLRLSPSRAPRAGSRVLLAAVLIAGVIPYVLSLREPRIAAAIRAGGARVADELVLDSGTGNAVAFVAVPERGERRAVIAWLDMPRGSSDVSVLPAGTRPIGWLPRTQGLVVAWSDGTQRVIALGAGRSTEPAHGRALVTPLPPVRSRVVDGTLVRDADGGGTQVIYPMGGRP